jgi:hypothetical protein
MLKNTVGYPDLINLGSSSMNLETAGIVSTPNFFSGKGLEKQKTYFAKGFQGVGLDDPPEIVPSAFSANSLFGLALAAGMMAYAFSIVGDNVPKIASSGRKRKVYE